MHYVLFIFISIPYADLLFWKLLVCQFLLGRSEALVCALSDPHVRTARLLDVHQLASSFEGVLTYVTSGAISLNILLRLLHLCTSVFAHVTISLSCYTLT
jgi:hypothetical protein